MLSGEKQPGTSPSEQPISVDIIQSHDFEVLAAELLCVYIDDHYIKTQKLFLILLNMFFENA